MALAVAVEVAERATPPSGSHRGAVAGEVGSPIVLAIVLVMVFVGDRRRSRAVSFRPPLLLPETRGVARTGVGGRGRIVRGRKGLKAFALVPDATTVLPSWMRTMRSCLH